MGEKFIQSESLSCYGEIECFLKMFLFKVRDKSLSRWRLKQKGEGTQTGEAGFPQTLLLLVCLQPRTAGECEKPEKGLFHFNPTCCFPGPVLL